ncbi:serine/threonine-protein kinase pim-2-like [Clarias gariepinus]|uniref:serine/threonine-protein kinase pim-2-like n=1 Tax=Clarias gariepinus TaxID=13013 RepID=UPI00234CF8E6|nr:serine/threonine-protein kinase pim-2-like [Clarias gariepinus]
MSAPDNELRKAAVKMGDDLASRGLTYAAHICYVVVKMDLGSHSQFDLIGCDSSRMPFGLVVLSEAIMRTETYEYALSLISGLAQPSFQMLKLVQASRLAYFDLAEGNSCGVAQKYCETMTRAAMAFPDKITDSFIERLILMSFNLLEEKAEEPEWLLDLQQLREIKQVNANAYGEPEQRTVSTSHEVVSESQDPLQSFDLEWPTDPEALFNARYTVQEPLGTGGFGSVYAGVREKDGKRVAIKFVNKKKLSNTITIPGEMQVLPLEVALMKMVSKTPRCNNVVELLEWFDLGIKYIMVLERPSACMDVWEFAMLHDDYLSEAQAKDIMLQVVWAARHCCERGVVHFDIKAENLLINTDTMEVKLIDFGAGELLKDIPYQTFSGTKGYEPPEWLLNEEYKGIPATIWGLGILMYYLVCGHYPFESKEDFFSGHLELRPDMSRECFDLMMWCLDLNPEMRPGFNILLRHEWFTEAVYSK